MKCVLFTIIMACFSCALTTPVTAQELADFNFFTMFPRDVDGVATPFESRDTVYGLCHSNDSMFFRGSPTFYGPGDYLVGRLRLSRRSQPPFRSTAGFRFSRLSNCREWPITSGLEPNTTVLIAGMEK